MGQDEDERRGRRPEPEPARDEPSAVTPAAGGTSGGGRRPPHRGWRRWSERYPRLRHVAPVSEPLEHVIKLHHLTEVVRQHAVYIFWREMVGRMIASKTSPDSLSRGVLRVWTKNSVWAHELQFHKAEMIQKINAWVGAPPLVTEIRFALSSQREPVDPVDHLRQLRRSMWQKMRAQVSPPAVVPEAERQAILAETRVVQDDDVRAEIERVRLRWGR